MTEIDNNGNTVSENTQSLTAKVKRLKQPVEFEVQQWGRFRVMLPNGGVITFFSDEEDKLLEWIINNGKEI